MPPEGPKRRLTAILSADVAGYSRLMGEDDDATVRAMTGSEQGARIIILCTSCPKHVLWFPQLRSHGRGMIRI